jgi:vacuolar iron transporter family protein
MLACTAGGLIPFLATVLAPGAMGIWVSGAAVLLALALTRWISALHGGAHRRPSIARNVFAVGRIAGTQL